MKRMMKRSIGALAIAFLAAVLMESGAEAAISGLCPSARSEIYSLAKRQTGILLESATSPRGGSSETEEKRAMIAVASEFNRALAEGKADRIWNALIPKNSRGAIAVAMGSDPDSGDFSVEIYRTIKGFPEGQKVTVEGFRDELKGGSRRLEAERMEAVGRNGSGVVFVKYKGGKRFPIMMVKSRGSWKVDLATMMSLGKRNLVGGAASSAKDLANADRTDAADDLLRDALSLESAFRRASKEPLKSSINRNALDGLESQLGDFKAIKSLLEGIAPRA